MNENADKQKVEWLSDRFYKSEYNIAKLMEDIFTSDWFYEEKILVQKLNRLLN